MLLSGLPAFKEKYNSRNKEATRERKTVIPEKLICATV
jgi:hypothetical protein